MFSNNVYIGRSKPFGHCYSKQGAATMKDNKATMRKTMGWAALAYGAFTAISIIGPIVLDRLWSRKRQTQK